MTTSSAQPLGRLGDVLISRGFCTREVVQAAGSEAGQSGEHVGQILLDRAAVTSEQLATAKADLFGLEYRSVVDISAEAEAERMIPFAVARRARAVPFAVEGHDILVVAVDNPGNYPAFEDISMFTGMSIRPVVVSAEDLDTLLKRLRLLEESLDNDTPPDDEPVSVGDIDNANDAPTIKLVRSIISDAVNRGVSDIHLDPEQGALTVRYRIDGLLADVSTVPRRQAAAVISRIKILANLDIAERRMPQDGRIGLMLDGRRIDVRVAVLPLMASESAVLRILDAGRSPLSLDDLGMHPADRRRLEGSLELAQGAVLVTGPTGSGKTTTLYAVVNLVASRTKSLMTIEDPVEYRLPGVNQIQVAEGAGLTFATGLRAIVRADPDVIMVGEIRDHESAQIAVDAALTGHVVFSTLHTNDAPSGPMRLVEMGVEPYIVAASVNCVIAQRLARKLCSNCRRATRVPGEQAGVSGSEAEVFEAVGCARCNQTGYRGRIGLFEVMNVTDEMRSLIVSSAPSHQVAKLAIAQGMRTLRRDGLAKVAAGETTLAELARVLGRTSP